MRHQSEQGEFTTALTHKVLRAQ